jgi:flagellar basal-body rod protein FlgB
VSFATDPVTSVLHSALDGLALRERVIADNIANVDTPGFRASSVDFESSLQSAIADGSIANGAQPGAQVLATDTPVGENGNNVDLRKETLAAMQSQFQYQMVTRAVSDRFDLVTTVTQGQ